MPSKAVTLNILHGEGFISESFIIKDGKKMEKNKREKV